MKMANSMVLLSTQKSLPAICKSSRVSSASRIVEKTSGLPSSHGLSHVMVLICPKSTLMLAQKGLMVGGEHLGYSDDG